MVTPLDGMLEVDERVVFRTRPRPSRLKALALGILLVVVFFVAALLAAGLSDQDSIWLPITAASCGMLLPLFFCISLQAEIVVTDRRLLMGGSVSAWLFGTGPQGQSVDPGEIERIWTPRSGQHSIIHVLLRDGHRFSLYVFRRHRQFEEGLKDLLGEPSRWVNMPDG